MYLHVCYTPQSTTPHYNLTYEQSITLNTNQQLIVIVITSYSQIEDGKILIDMRNLCMQIPKYVPN